MPHSVLQTMYYMATRWQIYGINVHGWRENIRYRRHSYLSFASSSSQQRIRFSWLDKCLQTYITVVALLRQQLALLRSGLDLNSLGKNFLIGILDTHGIVLITQKLCIEAHLARPRLSKDRDNGCGRTYLHSRPPLSRSHRQFEYSARPWTTL